MAIGTPQCVAYSTLFFFVPSEIIIIESTVYIYVYIFWEGCQVSIANKRGRAGDHLAHILLIMLMALRVGLVEGAIRMYTYVRTYVSSWYFVTVLARVAHES